MMFILEKVCHNAHNLAILQVSTNHRIVLTDRSLKIKYFFLHLVQTVISKSQSQIQKTHDSVRVIH